MKTKYKPSSESKINENNIKTPLIEEHNTMGLRFKNKEITEQEWASFLKDWDKRFRQDMHKVTKNRVYVEDI